MNIKIYRISGIISCIVVLLILTLFFINSFHRIDLLQFQVLKFLSALITIVSLFFIFYSASQIIKEFDSFKIDKLIFAYIGTEFLFFIFSYLSLSSDILSVIYIILYIAFFIILSIIAVKLLKITNTRLNIFYFKAFVLAYLITAFILNSLGWFLEKNHELFKIMISEINDIITKFKYINIIPIIFALIFYIKPLKTKN